MLWIIFSHEFYLNCFSLFQLISIFQHRKKKKLLSCSYVSSPPPLNTLQHFKTMTQLFCTAIHSQQTSSAGESINITCMKVSLLLVCYTKTVSQFSFSDLLMPLITGSISLRKNKTQGVSISWLLELGGQSRGSVLPVPTSSVTFLLYTSMLYRQENRGQRRLWSVLLQLPEYTICFNFISFHSCESQKSRQDLLF